MMTRKPEERQRRVHLGCERQGRWGFLKVSTGKGAAPTETPEIRGPQRA